MEEEEEEEGRQEAPPPPRRRDDAEEEQEVGDEREPGADGGNLHAVPEDREGEKPPGGTGGSSSNNICSVCHEPWTSSGAHRICSCIPCGHVYGRSCLELWLARSTTRSAAAAAKCLWCGQEFRREDMINLYGVTEDLLEQRAGRDATSVAWNKAAAVAWKLATAAAWRKKSSAAEAAAAEEDNELEELAKALDYVADMFGCGCLLLLFLVACFFLLVSLV